jgi:hypothetical protein
MSSSISSSDVTAPHAYTARTGWRTFLLKALGFAVLLFFLDLAMSKVLAEGLRRYFGMNGRVDVLCVGHSRTILGIDAELLSRSLGMKVAKYAVNGANTADRYAMVRHFLSEHPEVRILIYDVESTTFTSEGLSSNSYRLFFPFIDNQEMATYLRSHSQSAAEFYLRKVLRTSRFDEVTASLAGRGLLNKHQNLKFGQFDAERARRWLEEGKNRPVTIQDSNLDIFMKTIEYTKSKAVTVLLVDMPTVDILNDIEMPKSEPVRNVFSALPKNYPHVMYLDLRTRYEDHHQLFYDMIHLNSEGQKLVTEQIAAHVRAVLSGEFLSLLTADDSLR